jgi:DNA-binding response OmpR family regulator
MLGGESVALSTADFDLLWELATHAGQIMDRDALLKKSARRQLRWYGPQRRCRHLAAA